MEESPSPFLTDELRQEMGKTAAAAARAVGYVGAGTIEFLVDKNRNFYFLEMNTRLQVEHPVTEEVLGLNLVKEQIYIASGRPLHLRQTDIVQRGHSIVKQVTEPNGLGIRIDSYIYEGYEIPVYYDPMISKLIVRATTREYAVQRMRAALDEYKVTGIKTNISYLNAIMHTPDFVRGGYDTAFLEKNEKIIHRYLREPFPAGADDRLVEDLVLIAAQIDYLVMQQEGGGSSPAAADTGTLNRWREFGNRKGVMGI